MSNSLRLEDLVEVRHVDETPKFALAHRRSKGAKGQGVRYEAKVQQHWKRQFGDFYIPSPWFQYRQRMSPNNWNYAQPDGILLDFAKGQITILEMKYSHTADAYFQLMDRYLPLLQKFFGRELWTFALCEVVWWYDKDVQFPCPVKMRKSVSDVLPREFAVHICRP